MHWTIGMEDSCHPNANVSHNLLYYRGCMFHWFSGTGGSCSPILDVGKLSATNDRVDLDGCVNVLLPQRFGLTAWISMNASMGGKHTALRFRIHVNLHVILLRIN